MHYSSGPRFSRAKPTGSFRVYDPSSRRVAAHPDTLRESRINAKFWSGVSGSKMEIQERFPSGKWVTVEVVQPKSPHTTKRAHATKTTAKRVAHATKARSKTSDKITIDQLAKMFSLPDWDKIDEMNQQHYWEASRGAEDQEEAEQAEQTEVYNQWYDAVEAAASQLFEKHGLELKPTGKQGTSTRRYDFKVVPQKSWSDAADKIRETINGVGLFHSDDLSEFLRSGPYTAREAVLTHLGHVKSYPAVYGSSSAHQLYDRAWR